ncbi:lytic murein transglycosylase [Sphingomonas flavescens]|uniref:lytic murein transglycosylase n=1 Tax=Sphingomonas flavescens TaxID=3132797 RepID=UPI002804BB8D|nr:lytic murein transglycosylase [Sphingomonas limnosediminicola]
MGFWLVAAGLAGAEPATLSSVQLAQADVTTPTYAAAAPDPWYTYKIRLAALARQQGVSDATVQANVYSLTVNQRVIELERSEPIARTSGGVVGALAPYLRSHVTTSLIRRGQANYADHYGSLRQLEVRFGVDPAVLMAIWGHETSYGTVTGSTDLLQALASLGYYGRRRDFFEAEFVAALKLMDQGVPRWRLKGSWAGATGYPQFMPSVALRLRADGDGDGYADIWSNELDGLASIATYLRDAGWKPNVAWGIPVRTPSGLNRAQLVNRTTAPRCPQVYRRHSRWLTMREWRALGVTAIGRGLPDTEMASLIEPDGPDATAYLLTTNYRAILDYNCSNFYAISVGVLADAIARR